VPQKWLAEHLAMKSPANVSQQLRRFGIEAWPFCMAYSKTLEETIFFCEDEATKAALIEAGADEWSIYTKNEVRILLANNRVAPLSPDELRKVHEIKRTFNGRIAK
jgi:pyrroloquinoline quinone (PQQ) biosynthesis protein C